MVYVDPNIYETLKDLNNSLDKKHGLDYAAGYMESLMGEILTAFVPARDRFMMLDVIKKRIESIENEV